MDMIDTNADYFSNKFGSPDKRVQKKIKEYIDDWAKNYISLSPFLVISSCDETGKCSASPRGGVEGFVKVIDRNTLAVPDYTGNKLFQTYRNILRNPQVGIIFLIPGVTVTVRISGSCEIINRDELIKNHNYESLLIDKYETLQCLIVHVSDCYYHCGRSVNLSKLWDVERIIRHNQNMPVSRRPG